MATSKIEEVATITNTYFAGLPDKSKVRVAGVISQIRDKETPSGQAKQFKGEIAVLNGSEGYLARAAFFPTVIRDGIISAVSKIGKWGSFEFSLTATKSHPEGGSPSWTVSFDISPRVEKARALALLDS